MRHLPLFLAALLAAGPALAENRGVAIANAQYQHAPPLADADASAAADAMRAAGFRTVAGTDLVIRDTQQALADLLRPDDTPGARLVLLNGRFLQRGSESWYMGTDADKPDLIGAGAQGVALSMVLDLLQDGQPGAVLLLGSDDGEMDHGAGLENGIGALPARDGVSVVSGPAAATAAAAVALLKPGASVADVLAADPRLHLAEGGDPRLVLIPATGADPLEGDRDLWAKAAAEDSAEAYRAYLDSHPSGLYSAAAKARLDALAASPQNDRDLWAEAAATNTIAAYDDYLARYPNGEFATAAQKRQTELRPAAPVSAPVPTPAPAPAPEIQAPRVPVQPPAGQLAESRLNLSRADRVAIQRRLNTLGYATGGADGVFGTRTRSAIRGWQQRSGYAVTGYLTSAQLGQLRAQANAVAPSVSQQDRDYWQRTGAKGGAANLRAYLDRYPNGAYAATARQRLADIQGSDTPRADREDRAWDRARQIDSVQSYNQYLQDWPRGEHAEQARQRRNRLLNQGQTGTGIGLDTIIRELIK